MFLQIIHSHYSKPALSRTFEPRAPAYPIPISEFFRTTLAFKNLFLQIPTFDLRNFAFNKLTRTIKWALVIFLLFLCLFYTDCEATCAKKIITCGATHRILHHLEAISTVESAIKFTNYLTFIKFAVNNFLILLRIHLLFIEYDFQ